LGGSPLNRLSWLRTSHTFLNAVISSASTRWILFNAGQPLVTSDATSQKPKLAQLTTKGVRSLIGPEPWFGQESEDNGEVVSSSEDPSLQAARLREPRIVFLGTLEENPESALPLSEIKDVQAVVANLEGTPFFSLDVAEVEGVDLGEVLKSMELTKENEFYFMEPRAAMGCLDEITVGIFAQARSSVDWNQRNKVSFH
jgi:NAD+ diphosphatase